MNINISIKITFYNKIKAFRLKLTESGLSLFIFFLFYFLHELNKVDIYF
jgi:hypothetical protein